MVLFTAIKVIVVYTQRVLQLVASPCARTFSEFLFECTNHLETCSLRIMLTMQQSSCNNCPLSNYLLTIAANQRWSYQMCLPLHLITMRWQTKHRKVLPSYYTKIVSASIGRCFTPLGATVAKLVCNRFADSVRHSGRCIFCSVLKYILAARVIARMLSHVFGNPVSHVCKSCRMPGRFEIM